jgi:REP element-mobilizing transposase RayT
MARMNARPILRGSTYLVTRRCTQRQFLLTPTNRRFVDGFHYCLAYAAARTRVVVHAVVVMGNHYHLVVSDPDGVLPAFVECLNKLVAKLLNSMRGRWENFWASEQASYVRLLDDAAVIDKIAYTLCNPVQEGLVQRGADWPGLRLGRPGRYRVSRPGAFFRAEGPMPDELSLEIATPRLAGTDSRAAQARIDEAVAERESTERDRILGEGRHFLGRRAVIQQDPTASPRTFEPRRRLSPRNASRNKWLRIEALSRCADFARAYRDAFRAWCTAQRDAIFPCGTYVMRLRHQVLCAEA